ncbi:MAG: alpha/beta hydrolase [Bacteroidota bacterium]
MDNFLVHKNTKIRYRDTGKGGVIVLLHGFLENLEMWDYFSSKLSLANRIVSIDLLGHGQTESVGYVHTMENMAEYVKAVLDHLRLKKYVIVGHSMGGYVALALAENYVDNIKGLCLFHSSSLSDSEEKKLNRDRAISLVKENHKSFIRTAIPMLFRPKNRKIFSEELKITKEQGLATSKQGVIAALEGMKIREDREVLLHFTPFPKLMIVGRYDSALGYDKLINQTKNAANMEIAEFPIGHMGHIEAREATLKSLKQFLRKV